MMKSIVFFLTALLLVLTSDVVDGFAAKHQHHRSHQVARNPDLAPGARHSTERLEEPGKKRNYGTEYTKDKKQRQIDDVDDMRHRDNNGRAWTFGKVPRF